MPSATVLVAQLLAGTRSPMEPDTEGFLAALAAQDSYYGYENLAKIHGEDIPAMMQAMSIEEEQVPGGRCNKGIGKLQVPVSLFAAVPKQGDWVEYLTPSHRNYFAGELTRIAEKAGNLWTLLIGEPAAMDRKANVIR